LIRDAEYFKARINKIEESGDIGEYLCSIAREKKIQPVDNQGLENPKTATPKTETHEEAAIKAARAAQTTRP
jgi:hypothetical protein